MQICAKVLATSELTVTVWLLPYSHSDVLAQLSSLVFMNNSPFSVFSRSIPGFSFFAVLTLVGAALAAVPARALVAQNPPKVAFIQPKDGEGFVNPPEIPILVEAADSDGYVKSVEVFTDLGSLGVITPNPASAQPANPFRWTWLNPPAGEHKLVAKAIDNNGNETFSDSLLVFVRRDVSPSPASLTFVKPEDGATLPLSDPGTIQVTAVDPNGDIRVVEFFANGVFIGRSEHLTKDAVIPGRPREHFLDWKPADVGFYRLNARAIDTQGNPVESKPISVTVGTTLPVVSLEATVFETSEPGPTIRVRPGMFTLRRKGDLAKPITVYLRYEGSATPDVDYKRLPDTVTFLAGAGEVQLFVEALEDSLAEGVESVIATLFDPPVDRAPDHIIDRQFQTAKVLIHDTGVISGAATLEITAPKDGDVFKPGETLVIEATAIDPNGYISRVEFYDFDKEIGVSELFFFRAPDPGTPIHHTLEWQNLPPGEHVLTARAVDSNGNPVISKAVRIHAGNLWTLPVVEVAALDPEAIEFPPFVDAVDPARFSITRTGDLEKELYVVFSLHGSAEAGKDFRHPGRTVRKE